jgi:hypothetical protein
LTFLKCQKCAGLNLLSAIVLLVACSHQNHLLCFCFSSRHRKYCILFHTMIQIFAAINFQQQTGFFNNIFRNIKFIFIKERLGHYFLKIETLSGRFHETAFNFVDKQIVSVTDSHANSPRFEFLMFNIHCCFCVFEDFLIVAVF